MDIQADRFAPAVEEAKPLLWTGLLGSSVALEMLQWAASRQQTIVVVCPSEAQAIDLYNQATFFHHHLGIKSKLLFYPARETDFKPSEYLLDDILDQRLSTLYYCGEKKPCIIVTSFNALAQKTIPKNIFTKHVHGVLLHDDLNRELLLQNFVNAGYERENFCKMQGTYSVRGDIIDFFSPNHPNPIRLEFFGDQVERISYYDVETQTSVPNSNLEYIDWIPSNEILLSDLDVPHVLKKIKHLADENDLPPSSRSHVEEALRERFYLPALEHLLPIFYDQNESLIHHLPTNASWVLLDPLGLQSEIQNIEFEFQKTHSSGKLQCPSKDFFIQLDSVESAIRQKTKLYISDVDFRISSPTDHRHFSGIHLNQDLQEKLIHSKKSEKPFLPLAEKIQSLADIGQTIYIAVSNAQNGERIQKILKPYLPDFNFEKATHIEKNENPFRLFTIEGDLQYGFSSSHHGIAIITEAEIFGEQKFKQAESITKENVLESIGELQVGDPLVHIDHGVGLYQGLQRMKINNVEHDFLIIQYLDQDKLFLPVYRLNRIHKYISADGKKAVIDRLGSQTWEQKKMKAQKVIEEMAQELIELYARRKIAKGYSYSKPDESYTNFEAEFPFEETRDQIKSIDEIFSDLESEKPMDRLLCGDVGFGKTEVALRAAYRVATEGKQVAILVPTTILCQQHYQTFKKRFENFALEIDFLSRFKNKKDAQETIERIKAGHTDIVIGTHRLLSKDVEFSNLGLLILDEEHRFGVKHKEHIKKFRNKIDVLTLTATPIPRTLQLSMTGIRDLSVINTPPLDRKSVHTILCNFDDDAIRNAVMKEISRNGQIFFLHNRVESIYTMKTYLNKILPKVRIGIAHGQMNLQLLEKTMLGFLNHDFDMLLCTTIIESGLDIPNANTLIVNRADTFGLSQLYQIRGRVGRSHKEAYAYLMVPDRDRMSRDAVKRLKVLKQFTELGSGLKISLHDLEIRGAGNLLGSRQSGQISSVGFELYSQLLEREIRKLKGEKIKEDIEPEIQVNIAAFIPDEYVPEQTERLRLYKRFSACKDVQEMQRLKTELQDRFGPLPQTVENLLEVVDLKMVARECGVVSLKISGFSPVIEFSDQASIDIDRLLEMAKKNPNIRLTPDRRLLVHFDSDLDPMEESKKILRRLQYHGKTEGK